jgi:hypothetical protein
MYMPDSKKDEVSADVVFDEEVPPRSEEYFKEIDEAVVTTDPIARDLKDFKYLKGQLFEDADRLGHPHQYQIRSVVISKGLIVGYRRPVTGPDTLGQEQKTPYHIADLAKLVVKSQVLVMTAGAAQGPVEIENCNSPTSVGMPSLAAQSPVSSMPRPAASFTHSSPAVHLGEVDMDPSVGFPQLGQRVDPTLRVSKDRKPSSSFYACANELYD